MLTYNQNSKGILSSDPTLFGTEKEVIEMKKVKFFTILCFSAAIVFGVATVGLQYYRCKGVVECAMATLLFGIAAEFLGNI